MCFVSKAASGENMLSSIDLVNITSDTPFPWKSANASSCVRAARKQYELLGRPFSPSSYSSPECGHDRVFCNMPAFITATPSTNFLFKVDKKRHGHRLTTPNIVEGADEAYWDDFDLEQLTTPCPQTNASVYEENDSLTPTTIVTPARGRDNSKWPRQDLQRKSHIHRTSTMRKHNYEKITRFYCASTAASPKINTSHRLKRQAMTQKIERRELRKRLATLMSKLATCHSTFSGTKSALETAVVQIATLQKDIDNIKKEYRNLNKFNLQALGMINDIESAVSDSEGCPVSTTSTKKTFYSRNTEETPPYCDNSSRSIPYADQVSTIRNPSECNNESENDESPSSNSHIYFDQLTEQAAEGAANIVNDYLKHVTRRSCHQIGKKIGDKINALATESILSRSSPSL